METEYMTPGSGSGLESTPVESCKLDKIRDVIADTLHTTAAKLNEKAVAPDTQPGMARCAQKASDWLENSSERVREFDSARTDARIRDYVSLNPGRSLLMAGAAGLVVGILLKRR